MMSVAEQFLADQMHPTVIIGAYRQAMDDMLEILRDQISVPVDVDNREEMLKIVRSSVGTKFVHHWLVVAVFFFDFYSHKRLYYSLSKLVPRVSSSLPPGVLLGVGKKRNPGNGVAAFQSFRVILHTDFYTSCVRRIDKIKMLVWLVGEVMQNLL